MKNPDHQKKLGHPTGAQSVKVIRPKQPIEGSTEYTSTPGTVRIIEPGFGFKPQQGIRMITTTIVTLRPKTLGKDGPVVKLANEQTN